MNRQNMIHVSVYTENFYVHVVRQVIPYFNSQVVGIMRPNVVLLSVVRTIDGHCFIY